jgi:hypothetical protein
MTDAVKPLVVRFYLQKPAETSRAGQYYYTCCMKFLAKTNCRDKSCAVHFGEGYLCRRHTETIRLFWEKELARQRKLAQRYRPDHEYGGPKNYLCLSCFALNKHCHCPDQDKCVICIGWQFRTPRASAPKRVWLKELKQFPHLLFWNKDYPEELIGCRYKPTGQKVKA